MTLGLHDVAPRRQQRFVEVLNTGSAAPAFAVLEAYGSQTPDGDSSRTVLLVRQPQDPSRYPVVFNGPHPLAGGGYGVATAELPAWALSGSATPGEVVGPKQGSWQLSQNGQGFVVCGGSHAGATRVMAAMPEGLVRFELASDLILAGSATAWLLEWDGSSWVSSGTLILVADWYRIPGMWQGYTGYRGFAAKHPKEPFYEVVWMETPARSIEFTLLGPLAAGSALATLQKSYLQGKPPNASVEVFDATGNYARALLGAQGKARWNDLLRRYEVIECNQMAIALSCLLAGDMCVSSATGSLTGGSVMTFPPYGQPPNPAPSEASNRYSLAGRSGDACLVLWDQAASQWVIAQVAHHEVELPLKYRFYEGHLQAKHRKLAVMYCADETNWRNEIELHAGSYVYGVRYTGCGSSTSPGSSASQDCGAIEMQTAQSYFFSAPSPGAWSSVMSFQEQAVLIAAAGSGNCIVFQEATVCTPCVGVADTTRVCATVGTTVSCQCTCSGGDSGGSYGSGSYSDCSCSCVCQASSSIVFG